MTMDTATIMAAEAQREQMLIAARQDALKTKGTEWDRTGWRSAIGALDKASVTSPVATKLRDTAIRQFERDHEDFQRLRQTIQTKLVSASGNPVSLESKSIGQNGKHTQITFSKPEDLTPQMFVDNFAYVHGFASISEADSRRLSDPALKPVREALGVQDTFTATPIQLDSRDKFPDKKVADTKRPYVAVDKHPMDNWNTALRENADLGANRRPLVVKRVYFGDPNKGLLEYQETGLKGSYGTETNSITLASAGYDTQCASLVAYIQHRITPK